MEATVINQKFNALSPSTNPAVELKDLTGNVPCICEVRNETRDFFPIIFATQQFVLSTVFVYQLAVLYSFLLNSDLRIGFKALLKAA